MGFVRTVGWILGVGAGLTLLGITMCSDDPEETARRVFNKGTKTVVGGVKGAAEVLTEEAKEAADLLEKNGYLGPHDRDEDDEYDYPPELDITRQ